jgi:hypothetical protein
VGQIKIEDLNIFLFHPVEVAILDEKGEKIAPFVRKTIQKITLCPDQTHVRIYFDDFNFFAVPMDSHFQMNGEEWSAYDAKSELRYIIRKENEYGKTNH